MQQALLTPVPLPSCVGQEESSQGTEGVRTGSPRGEQGLADPCGRDEPWLEGPACPQEWWCHGPARAPGLGWVTGLDERLEGVPWCRGDCAGNVPALGFGGGNMAPMDTSGNGAGSWVSDP